MLKDVTATYDPDIIILFDDIPLIDWDSVKARVPRFIILQTASLINTSNLPRGELIVGELNLLMRLERVCIVFTTGMVSIGKVVG